VDHVIDRFSPDRVMAGSNWPVVLLCANFVDAWHGIEEFVAGPADTERQAILGAASQRIYGI
jgi:L-fuconolactonase